MKTLNDFFAIQESNVLSVSEMNKVRGGEAPVDENPDDPFKRNGKVWPHEKLYSIY